MKEGVSGVVRDDEESPESSIAFLTKPLWDAIGDIRRQPLHPRFLLGLSLFSPF